MKSFGYVQILCWLIWLAPELRVTGQILAGNWTWVGGTNTANQVAVYGTQGVADVNHRPGVRESFSMVMHPSGKLIFVFGGYGYDTATTVGKSRFLDCLQLFIIIHIRHFE